MKKKSMKPLTMFILTGVVFLFIAAPTFAVETYVSFQALHNGKYIYVKDSGGQKVQAPCSVPDNYGKEVFKMTCDSGSSDTIPDGASVNIRAVTGYFSAQSDGDVDADRTEARSWETFKLINLSNPGRYLQDGDRIGLKSCHGKYVRVDEDDDICARSSVLDDPNEMFTVVFHLAPDYIPDFGVEQYVSFQALHNGKYVYADTDTQTIKAVRDIPDNWMEERFVMSGESTDGYTIPDRAYVTIRTNTGYYFSAQDDGDLDADRTRAGTWETFKLINLSNPGGYLQDGDLIGLKSFHSRYVRVNRDSDEVYASSSDLDGDNEMFTVVFHPDPDPLPVCCPGCPRHPYSLDTCALPFPSDYFTPEQLEATFSEDVLSQLPESLLPGNILNDRDGWSPSTALIFEAPYEIDEEDLPVDGGAVLKVFDMDDPHAPPVPVRVRLSQPAELEARNWHYLSPIPLNGRVIQAFPRSRFPFGHRLAAVLTTALKAADGRVPTAPEIPDEYVGLAYELADRGVDPDTILSMTEFTVASEENTTGKLFEMIDVVKRQPHSLRNLKTEYSFLPRGVMVWLRGQVRLTSFRDPVDGTVQFEPGDTGTDYWADFDLYLPEAAKYSPVPVIIYGHGLSMEKSTAAYFAEINGLNGKATIAIDFPNHGTRIDQDGKMTKLFAPETLGHIIGMAVQGILDTHSVHQAILTSLADLDIAPKHEWINSWMSGYSKPDIDTDKIYYMGTSLGGVFGSGFVGSADNLDGAFLQVAGTGIMRTLSLSGLYEELGFYKMVPLGVTPAEAAVLFAYVQNIVDVMDGNNLIHNIQDPDVGGQVTPITVQYGLYDSVVHNDSSEALAEIAGLKQVGPIWWDLDFVPNTTDYNTPFRLVQGMWPVPPIEVFDFDLATIQHGSFLTPSALVAYESWLLNIR